MKKITSVLLALLLAFSFAACSSQENTGKNESVAETPLALLNSVWEKYGDDEKFPVAGGDFSEENASQEGPGKYSIEDAEALDAALGFPAASIALIDDAASFSNMMNANNFTCGAYHIVSGTSSDDVVTALKDNIATRQWMCGFPEKLIIATVGDYVIAAFGATDLITTFTEKLQSVYPTTSIVVDEPIA